MLIRNDGYFHHPQPWRGAGVAVPVFSLRSSRSCGVGDFVDIRRLVDLCAAIGLQMVQVLPVNDTSVHLDWRDSYPYSSLSVFALHPLYLAVDDMIGMGGVGGFCGVIEGWGAYGAGGYCTAGEWQAGKSCMCVCIPTMVNIVDNGTVLCFVYIYNIALVCHTG